MVSGGTYGTEDIVHGAGYGAGDPHPADHAAAVEPAHRADDRRACPAPCPAGGRLLRLGAARPGRLLGISGGVAVAGGQRLRHGDLSHAVRRCTWRGCFRGSAWGIAGCWSECRGGSVCAALNIAGIELWPLTSIWLFFLLSAPFARHRRAGAVQARSLGARCHAAQHIARRTSSAASAGRDVELHGLGQRLDHRGRGRASAANVSPRHAGGGGAGCDHLHSSCCSHVGDEAQSRGLGDRFVGGHRRPAGRAAAARRAGCWAA